MERINQLKTEIGEVEWLWWERLPLGKVAVLDGKPGFCKSALIIDLIARISSGASLPDNVGGGPSSGAGVVIVSGEYGHATHPRLETAGADLKRVIVLNASGEQFSKRSLNPEDLSVIESAVRALRAKLLILDLNTIADFYLGELIRRSLMPLAERTGAAILVTCQSDEECSIGVIAAVGVIAAARVVLSADQDPLDDEQGVLAVIKSNFSIRPRSLSYAVVAPKGGAVKLEWEGGSE